MRALHARLIFTAFLGVAAVITYNATFRQTGSHPTPLAEPQDVRAEGAPSRPADSATGAAQIGSDTVQAIQRELAQRGYDPGPIDGVLGWSTRAAIMAYQHDKELAVTGVASMGLLQHIVLGESTGTPPRPSDAAVPEETIRLVQGVQQALAELGYGPGPVDGIMGDGTRRAIESFERDQGLPATGRISSELLRELTRITGRKPEQLAAG